MNTFGVALFQQPQQFVALYLGFKKDTPRFLERLAVLLQRTKSPPLALTYTYHFLSDKTEEELSLDVIRFISQLADLSQGVSMSSSLQGILSESGFLTELRHSLTHKTMVKGSILQLGKVLILQELEDKYWKTTINKLRDTYAILPEKVVDYYRNIYNSQLNESLSWLKLELSPNYFQTCSNYEYKEHITPVIRQIKFAPLSVDELQKHYGSVSEQKQSIFQILLFQDYLQAAESENQPFTSFICKFLRQMATSHYENQLVLKECYKAYFLKHLTHAKTFVECLPGSIQKTVEEYWKAKQEKLGELYRPS